MGWMTEVLDSCEVVFGWHLRLERLIPWHEPHSRSIAKN